MTSADVTGRASGYKGVKIRCPGCAEAMRTHTLSEPHSELEAEVDVCDSCGGMWVDWFDGEVRLVATETLRTSDPGPAPSPASASKDEAKDSKDAARPSRNEANAVGACPRCHNRQLVPERYEVKAEVASNRIEGRTSVIAGKTGAELLRCEDCMGSFVSRSSAEVLSWLSNQQDEPPPQSQARPDGAAPLKPLPWDRFVGLLKGLVSGGSKSKPTPKPKH